MLYCESTACYVAKELRKQLRASAILICLKHLYVIGHERWDTCPSVKGEVKFQDKLYAEKQPPREY